MPLAHRARGAGWGVAWVGIALAVVEAVRVWIFGLLTWAPGIGFGTIGTRAMPAYLAIEHPWGFTPARAGDVWALAVVLE